MTSHALEIGLVVVHYPHQLSNHVRPLKSNKYLHSKETSHHAKHIPWTSAASRFGTSADFPVVLPQTSGEICGDAGVGARTTEGTKYIAAIAWKDFECAKC